MFQNWTKIRRHAEKLAGGKDADPRDIQMWHDRIRKACRKGDILNARRQGDAGDYLVLWKEVERWFRTEFQQVLVAFFWCTLILSPMLLPGGAI